MLKNMQIGLKLTLLFSLIGILAIAIIGAIGYTSAKSGLEEEAYNKLLAVREAKKARINQFIEDCITDITVLGDGRDVGLLYEELVRYHDETDVAATGSYDVTTSEYRQIHEKYGRILEKYVKVNGYHDIHMICKPHGHVMYAVKIEDDLGTNLGYGKYKDTNLAELWREVVRAEEPYFADFESFEPAGGEPAAFIGAPIYNDQMEMIGVLALEISVEQINDIMLDRHGLGETGEAYLVGSDYLMRSDSYLNSETHSVKASIQNPTQGKIQTEAVQEALVGESGQKIIEDYRGEKVLSSYAPIDFLGVRWALLAEIDESEAFQNVYSLRNQIFFWAIILVVLVILASVFFARSITKRIKVAVGVARKLSEGDLDVDIQVESEDEIGQLLASMEDMTAYIHEVADVAQKIAIGDIRVRVIPKSNRDVLNHSFQRTINYIQDVADATEKISEGDLRVDIEPKSDRDVLNRSLKRMVTNLREIVQQLVNSSQEIFRGTDEQSSATEETSSSMEQIAASIRQVASNADSLSSNVEETSASIEQILTSIESVSKNSDDLNLSVDETSSTIQELAASIEEIAVNSREVVKSSQGAVDEAEQGAESVKETIDGMEQISETMRDIVSVIETLNESSEKINTIVDVIDDIAEQTNLLALNAAIEAARAGEHGRGFAVVADEVRKLAERSASSAKEIVELITDVQEDTTNAIKVTNQGYQRATEGVKLAGKAGETLDEISDAIKKVNLMMKEVSKVTQQQAQASDRIVGTVENMRKMTRQVNNATNEQATSSRQIMKAVETMNAMTRQVSTATNEQRKGGEQIVQAIENITRIARNLASQAEKLKDITSIFKV